MVVVPDDFGGVQWKIRSNSVALANAEASSTHHKRLIFGIKSTQSNNRSDYISAPHVPLGLYG